MCKPDRQITVVLIEDYPVVVAGISSWIREFGYALLGVAWTAEEGLAMVRSLRPDIVIVDVCLNKEDVDDGIEMTATIRDIAKSIPKQIAVLHMTGENPPNPGRMLKSIRSGADGFWLKTDGADPLATTLGALSRGQNHFNLDSNEHFAAMQSLRRRIESKSKANGLTQREYEVFWFYVQYLIEFGARQGAHGHIADKIGCLSATGVERHMNVIRQKLQVEDKHALDLLIKRAGYFEVPPTFYEDREGASDGEPAYGGRNR